MGLGICALRRRADKLSDHTHPIKPLAASQETHRMPSTIPQPLSRRTFLRGVGVTMALPWLESAAVWGDDAPKYTSSEPPVRFAVLFSGNGYHSKEWWARGEGSKMEVG